MKHSSWLTYLLLGLMLSLLSCDDNAPADSSTTDSQKDNTRDAPASPSAREQALATLQGYYDALEREQIDVSQYFAPTVERFFDGRNLSHSEIQTSLNRGFEQINDRQIEIDPSSLKLTELADGYQVEFRGTSTSTNAATDERNQGDFHNQVVFNQDWLITVYKAAESKSRGLAARDAASSSDQALMQIAMSTLTAFRQGNLGSAESLIHPDLGYYFIYSPGAMNVPQHFQTLAGMTADAPWMGEGNRDLDQQPNMVELPSFSCDDDFSKAGCFLQRLDEPFALVSALQEQLLRVELIGPDQVDESRVQRIEAKVSAGMIDTDAFMAFYFGQVDGQWYLLIVDTATYDCSA